MTRGEMSGSECAIVNRESLKEGPYQMDFIVKMPRINEAKCGEFVFDQILKTQTREQAGEGNERRR